MFFLAITSIPFGLYLLHFMTGVRTKTDLRQRITDLYVTLGELSESGRFSEVLAHLKKTMIKSRKWFYVYYTCVSFACLVSTFPGIIIGQRHSSESNLIALSNLVIDLHFDVTFGIARSVSGIDFYYIDDGKQCVARKNAGNFVDSKPGQKEKVANAIRSFSNSDLKCALILSEIISDLFTFATVGVAIAISMKVTLFFLSNVAKTSAWLFVSIATSLAVALISPFLMIELSTYLAVTSMVTFNGGLPDFFGIENPTVVSVAAANAATTTLILLNPESIFAVVWQKLWPDSWLATAIYNSVLSPLTISVSWDRFISFISDLNRFNNFDFEATGIEGIRNWGVGTDLAFSLSYLVLSVLLVSAYRKESVRDYMLNELQEIDSSKDGPLLTIASKTKILMGAALALIGRK